MTEKRYTILEDLEVREVSIVDRGANKRSLLVVKNAGADMDENTETTSDPVVEAQAEKATAETDLIVSLPTEIRDGLSKMLTDVGVRISALGEAVKASQPGEGGVSDKFKNEVVAVSTALRKMVGVEKADDLTAIDKLFAAPAPVDAMQMAAPEYVMTAEGPLMRLPPDVMKQVACKYAMDLMFKAEDALMGGDLGGYFKAMAGCVKTIAPFAKSEDMPEMLLAMMDKQYAFNQPQPSIAAGVPDGDEPKHAEQPGSGAAPVSDMAKAGRKISGDRLAKLQAMLQQLSGLVGELDPAAATDKAKPVAKSDDAELNALRGQVTALAELAKRQETELKKFRGARPIGNATQIENDNPNPPASGKVLWPDDLNDLNDADLVG